MHLIYPFSRVISSDAKGTQLHAPDCYILKSDFPWHKRETTVHTLSLEPQYMIPFDTTGTQLDSHFFCILKGDFPWHKREKTVLTLLLDPREWMSPDPTCAVCRKLVGSPIMLRSILLRLCEMKLYINKIEGLEQNYCNYLILYIQI